MLLFWPSQFIIKWMMNQYFHGVTLHAFGPADVIITELKFSVICGVVVGLPVLLSQIWLFVVPAVNPRTRRMVYSFVVPSLLLAFAGLAFAHFLVIPRVIAALLALTSQVAEGDVRYFVDAQLRDDPAGALRDHLSDSRSFSSGLARLGIVNAPMLMKYRRHAFFGMIVVSGIAAPDGNPMTMLLLAVPMYVLYEISIWVIVLFARSWHRSST